MPEGFDLNQNYYIFNNNNTTPLVFIHGVGLDHRMWQPQINYFNKYSTIAYDLLGHGKTIFDNETITIDDFSNQLISILNFLKIDKINLIGFSLGALIALNFASKFQNNLSTLTLIGTTYKRSHSERVKVLDRYNQAKLNKSISKIALERWFSDEYLKLNPQIYDQFVKILNKNPKDHSNFLKSYHLFANHEDDIELIKKIKTKTLIMTGSNDPGSTVAMSKTLSKDMINSNFVEINKGKHLCSIECADDVNIKIKNFIDG
ncbi:MAG: alpha/beta hydrolase [Pelagibacteraceae bacterium]|nr:alpha/beta hydrolase [Pelagibacteraceae bacterium]